MVRRNWPSTMQVSMNLFLDLKDEFMGICKLGRTIYVCIYIFN